MRRLIIVLAAVGWAAPTDALAQRRADPAVTYSVPLGNSPVRGPADALVTLVTACEFGSPFCSRIRSTLDQLSSEYDGDLRIAYKHFVVYKKKSTDASLAACAAHRQGRFFEMEQLIWTQGYRANRDLSLAKMRTLATELGLDMKQFTSDMGDACPKVLASDHELMERVGTRGVPATYVNGRFVSGARSFDSFKKVVDEELAKARTRVAQGARRASYYREHVVDRGDRQAAKVPPRPHRPARPDDVGRLRRPRPDPALVYAARVGQSPTRGPADAKVTMVLGCQFSGPFCQRLQPLLRQLREDYGADLRIAYKHFVVHRNRATAPALAACAAHRQGKYFDMEAILWGEAWAKRTWDAESMRGYAENIGLDLKRYDEDVTGACPRIVEAEQAELQKLGARGTPNAFINGRFLSGARPIDQFRALIDEELAKADKRIKSPKQQRRYYHQYVVKQGKKSL